MLKLNCELREISPDFRSKEMTFELIISNNNDFVVNIVDITPLIPDNCILLESKEYSNLTLGYKYNKLTKELTFLAQEYLKIDNKPFQQKYSELYAQSFTELVKTMSTLSGIARLYYYTFKHLFKPNEKYYVSKSLEKLNSINYNIDNYSDAKIFKDKFMDNADPNNLFVLPFIFKFDKLEILESQLNPQNQLSKKTLFTLEQGALFNATYIVRFKRNKLVTSRQLISLIITYQKENNVTSQNTKVSKGIEISPSPLILSVIAVISGILGVLLKFSINPKNNFDALFATENNFINNMIASSILSLIIFNTFEYTELFKTIRNRLAWRTALIIGFSCGIASNRIFEAFFAFLGKK